MEPDCVSINLDKRADGDGTHKCELNNVTHEGHEDELKEEENYSYHGAEASNASKVMISVFVLVFCFLFLRGNLFVFLSNFAVKQLGCASWFHFSFEHF